MVDEIPAEELQSILRKSQLSSTVWTNCGPLSAGKTPQLQFPLLRVQGTSQMKNFPCGTCLLCSLILQKQSENLLQLPRLLQQVLQQVLLPLLHLRLHHLVLRLLGVGRSRIGSIRRRELEEEDQTRTPAGPAQTSVAGGLVAPLQNPEW